MQYQQWIPYNTPHHTPPYTPVSQNIMGEGDVVAIMSSEGALQYFFIPTFHSSPLPQNTLYDPNSNCGNSNAWNPNKPLWFVRSMCNPYHIETYPRLAEGIPLSSPIPAGHVHPVQPFELKFHNDCWTSTTDLHYFYPSLRQYNWFPSLITKGSAAVQVEMPNLTNNVCHYEIVCNCALKRNKSNCSNRDSASVMSIDEVASKCKPKKLNKKSSTFIKRDECNCSEINTLEKSVTTYTDRASGLSIAAESQTNTNSKKKVKKTKPKRKGKKQTELETDETTSCQSCCCNSETE